VILSPDSQLKGSSVIPQKPCSGWRKDKARPVFGV